MTTPCRERWTPQEIRTARMALLPALLVRRKLTLIEREAGNFAIAEYPGVIVKDSYWRWPERDVAGNAIDFFTKVVGMNFRDAMRFIVGR